MPKKSLTEEIETMAEECRKSFEQWENIYANGCQDPFWEDGINLNLVRNHIIYFQRQMTDLCEENGYFKPVICSREFPPEVDQHYMARKNEIKQAAQNTLQSIEQDDDYLSLISLENKLTDEQKKVVYYSANLGYVDNLRNAVVMQNYVAMRRYSNSSCIIESVVKCLDHIKKLITKTAED